MHDVCVIGLGTIGLPLAALLAHRGGFSVLGAEIDPQRRDWIRSGAPDSVEPGLSEVVKACVGTTLTVVTQPEPAPATVICVPTPVQGRQPDLTAMWAAVKAVEHVCPADGLVVLECTVPVGTTEQVAQYLRQRKPAVRVAISPERILPGAALAELQSVHRNVGGVDAESTTAAMRLYEALGCPLDPTDARTAELCKLSENAARDVHLALANELETLATTHGVSSTDLFRRISQHPRVSVLNPGIGVGGHCIPVDPWFLIDQHEAPLLRAARHVNDSRPDEVLARIDAACEAHGASRIALLGLAYKPGVGDLRNSPALEIATRLKGRPELEVRVADPHVQHPWIQPLETALEGADLVVWLVDHPAWRDLALSGTPMLDLCGARS